ncbi:MAG: hypothetical protein PHS56_04395, partial [Eubacteriales bacterium]|nr:hypothetical protein [Eubacteriales bacterium]
RFNWKAIESTTLIPAEGCYRLKRTPSLPQILAKWAEEKTAPLSQLSRIRDSCDYTEEKTIPTNAGDRLHTCISR